MTISVSGLSGVSNPRRPREFLAIDQNDRRAGTGAIRHHPLGKFRAVCRDQVVQEIAQRCRREDPLFVRLARHVAEQPVVGDVISQTSKITRAKVAFTQASVLLARANGSLRH